MELARFIPIASAAAAAEPRLMPLGPASSSSAAPRFTALGGAGEQRGEFFTLPVTSGFKSLVQPAEPQPEADGRDPIRKAAEDMVALSLIKPMLDQAAKNPFKTKLFHGGQGEEAFTDRLHDQFASRMAQHGRLPVVDAVYRQLTRQSGAAGEVSGMRQGVMLHG